MKLSSSYYAMPPPPPPVMARPVAIIRSTGTRTHDFKERGDLIDCPLPDMTSSPPPPVTPPPLAQDSSANRSPMSPSASMGHSAAEMRGPPTTNSSNTSAPFGRDYTFSHLHAQSGQVISRETGN